MHVDVDFLLLLAGNLSFWFASRYPLNLFFIFFFLISNLMVPLIFLHLSIYLKSKPLHDRPVSSR